MKKLAFAATALFVLAAAAIAGAQAFDEESGTATVMVSGGTVYEDHTTTAQVVSGGGAVVATVTLPAGRYEVTGKTWVEDGSSAANFAQCGLTGLGVNENARSTIAASGFETLTVLGVVDLATETDVDLFCTSNSTATANLTVLHATTVSAINSQ